MAELTPFQRATQLAVLKSRLDQAKQLNTGDRSVLKSAQERYARELASGQDYNTGAPLTQAIRDQRESRIEILKAQVTESDQALQQAQTELQEFQAQAPVDSRDSAGTDIQAKQPEVASEALPLSSQQETNLDQNSNFLPSADAEQDSEYAAGSVDSADPSNSAEPVTAQTSSEDDQDPDAASGSQEASRSLKTPGTLDSRKQGAKPVTKPIIPSNNILHDYVNYTYLLSWHLMTITDYNNLVTNPESRYTPRNVLVSSAGKYNAEFARSPAWREDFYFESLDMQTVIGLNARSRGSNAVDISFKIIEPYGASLLERLLRAADGRQISVAGVSDTTQVTAKNYTQLPYMLQIDFAGYTDSGQMKIISEATKYIPINVLSIEFKVSNRGSEYSIRAVPFNHQAFKSSQASLPANFEIAAKTVGEFFKGTGIRNTSSFIEKRRENFERRDQFLKTAREAERNVQAEAEFDWNAVKDLYLKDVIDAERTLSTYAVDGLESALNDFYLFEKYRGTITVEPEYYFEIDEEIAKTKIARVAKSNPSDSPIRSTTNGRTDADRDYQNSQKTKKDAPAPGIPFDPETNLSRLNAGTNIVELITYVIRNSDYILDQIDQNKLPQGKLTEREAYEIQRDQSKPLMWFKIVPKLEIKNYDTKLNSYAFRVTYQIKAYPIYGRTLPRVSKARVPADQISKIYNYIYSGENQDILDLNIEFNTQYFMAITSSPGKFFSTSAAIPDEQEPAVTEERSDDPNFQVRTGIISSNQRQSYSQTSDPRVVAASDVVENLMNSSADMISVKLKIIGDPAWIKQDDIFVSSERLKLINQEATRASSIPSDESEVYVRLNFRVPTDIDDEKGIYKFSSEPYSVFSGIYRVLTVDNKFEKGQFTQDLDLVRILNQPGVNQTPETNNRETSQAKQNTNTVSVPTTSAEPRSDQEEPEQGAEPRDDDDFNFGVAGDTDRTDENSDEFGLSELIQDEIDIPQDAEEFEIDDL